MPKAPSSQFMECISKWAEYEGINGASSEAIEKLAYGLSRAELVSRRAFEQQIDDTSTIEEIFPDTIDNKDINRILNALSQDNITSVGDLRRRTYYELARIPNIGRKSLNIIVECLKEHWIELGSA